MRYLFGKRVRRATLVVAICGALMAGVALARLPGGVLWAWLGLPAVALALVRLRTHDVGACCLLVVAGLSLGLWRGGAVWCQTQAQAAYYHQRVMVVGQATDEAIYGQRSQLEVVLTRVRLVAPDGQPLPSFRGDITARGFGESMIYRGDTVQVVGKLYPSRGNSVATMSFANLEVLHHDAGLLNHARRQFAAGMHSALPEPHASFALGLLIGQRSTLPVETNDQLRQVGLTHIIAVSGYNLTILVLLCRRLFARQSKFQATAACALLLLTFLLLTGTSPPVVRAAIISMLSITAWYYGREIKPLALLLVGAAGTALANPLHLWGNVSWYLSFLSFYGVLVLAPLVTRRLWGARQPKLLGSLVVETMCATVTVVPYVLYIFGQVSLVSLPANIAVVPFIPLAMMLALAAGLAGTLLPMLAGWLAWPAHWLLLYMLDIAGLLSRLPHAFVDQIGFSLPALLFCYALLGLGTVVLWHKTRAVAKDAEYAALHTSG